MTRALALIVLGLGWLVAKLLPPGGWEAFRELGFFYVAPGVAYLGLGLLLLHGWLKLSVADDEAAAEGGQS